MEGYSSCVVLPNSPADPQTDQEQCQPNNKYLFISVCISSFPFGFTFVVQHVLGYVLVSTLVIASDFDDSLDKVEAHRSILKRIYVLALTLYYSHIICKCSSCFRAHIMHS